MKKSEFRYLSANGSAMLHACLWEPEGPVRAVLQIAHGITEHIGCYETLARYFTDRGIAVAGNDHLGHGLSIDQDEPLPMYFGPEGSWQHVVADIRRCGELLKERIPGVPHVLLGFSLGSFAVRCLMAETPGAADMTIWAGTGQMGPVPLFIARSIVRREERRAGDKVETPLLHQLTMDSYNQQFQPCRTGMDWLCANEAALDAYLADPLTGSGFTISSFRELLRGMKQCARGRLVARMPKTLPILLISGTEDPVGESGKGVAAVCRQLTKLGFTDVEMQLFDGMRHHIFCEKEQESVFARIAEWIGKRLPAEA